MPTPPCDERISYAIGDVHGHCRESQRLILAIRADMATYPAQTQFRVALIGDLIDRGPDSRGMIDEVIALITNRVDWLMRVTPAYAVESVPPT